MSPFFGQPCFGPAAMIFEPFGSLGALSNFADSCFELDGSLWPAVEHYFQACKFEDTKIRERIRGMPTAQLAKDLAWGSELHPRVRSDWDSVRLQIMQKAVDAKFRQSENARSVLLGTWPLPLIENSPVDSFWGIGSDGRGANQLGVILEGLRSSLGSGPSPLQLRTTSGTGGYGGPSKVVWTTLLLNQSLRRHIRLPVLAYSGFKEIDVQRLFHEGQIEGGPSSAIAMPHTQGLLKTDLYSDVMDRKYAHYTWQKDARSAVRNWALQFRGVVGSYCNASAEDAAIIVVGAGSANEAGTLWSNFGKRVTLVDCGQLLVSNCRREAPDARVLRRKAEDLFDLVDGSYDIYCALRTYDSALLHSTTALTEAWRLLRPGGTAIISISNGYLLSDGSLVSGQIVDDGELDFFRPWEVLIEVCRQANEIGFENGEYFDLVSEVGICLKRP